MLGLIDFVVVVGNGWVMRFFGFELVFGDLVVGMG